MSDPLMNPNPGIAATYMSNGGSSLDLMHSSFIAFQAGQLNYVASITKGIKTLFTNPSSLLTVDTYLSAVSQGIEMAYPHFRASRTNSRLQQAASTGDINNVFFALGGESTNLQMESLSLIPGAGIGSRLGVAVKGSTKLLTQGRFPNFAAKFTKHSGEWSQWGAISKNAFYNRAVKLADSPVGGSIRGFTSKQGYGFKFNSRTGEFLTTHPNGTIQTFFRPKQSLDYYLKQKQLYGN